MEGSEVELSREQTILETYFTSLSQFSFDKAKELVDKEERDGSRAHVGTTWHSILGILSHLAIAEKTYMTFGYHVTKLFLRTNSSSKTVYESVKSELTKVEASGKMDPSNPLEGLLTELCGQLLHLVKMRVDMIDLYVKLFNIVQNPPGMCEEFIAQITTCLNYGEYHITHKLLNRLRTGFVYECEILLELLSAELELENWSFMPSLFHLYTAHDKLNNWNKLLQPRESRRISFSPVGFLRQPQMPLLHQWLARFKGCMLSKFNIYFHENLSKQTTIQELKNLCSRVQPDVYQKVISFQKKVDLVSICLIFDARRCPDYQGHGYRVPKYNQESPQGLECFPAIFCYPPTKPLNHWPTIVISMENRATEKFPEKLVCLPDTHFNCTYFIAKVDVRMTLAVIINGKHTEKDSTITAFFSDISNSLRFHKMLSYSLRSG